MERKGSCLPGLCFPFSLQLPVLASHQLKFSSFAPQSPSFMFSQLMSDSLAFYISPFSCIFISVHLLVRLHTFLACFLLCSSYQFMWDLPGLFLAFSSLPLEDHFIPSHYLFSPWLTNRCHTLTSQPGTLENMSSPGHLRKHEAASLAVDGNGGCGPCWCGNGNGCTMGIASPVLWESWQQCQCDSQSCVLTWPAVLPPSRRCSCIAASSCAGRWMRALAAPRAAGDGCAGQLRQRKRRNLFTWQTTSWQVAPSELTLMTNTHLLEQHLCWDNFRCWCLLAWLFKKQEVFGKAPLNHLGHVSVSVWWLFVKYVGHARQHA